MIALNYGSLSVAYNSFSVLSRIYGDRKLERARQNYRSLSPAHQKLLPLHLAHIEQCAATVDTNHAFITAIIAAAENVFENSDVANIVCSIKIIVNLTSVKYFR